MLNKLGLSCAKLRANLAWLGLGIGLLRLICLHTVLSKTLAIFLGCWSETKIINQICVKLTWIPGLKFEVFMFQSLVMFYISKNLKLWRNYKFWKNLKFWSNLKFWRNLKFLSNLKFWINLSFWKKIEVLNKQARAELGPAQIRFGLVSIGMA